MEALKLLVFFIILSTGTSEFSDSNLQYIAGGYLPQTRNLFNLVTRRNSDEDNQSCVCFDKTQPPVTDFMTNTRNSLKRLVVYLYKDPEYDTLQLYAPNKEKQLQFPDLGFEDGDLFNVGPESIDEVFNTNHYTVDVINHRENSGSASGSVSPVDAKPAVGEVTHNHGDLDNTPDVYKVNEDDFSTDLFTFETLFDDKPNQNETESNSNFLNSNSDTSPDIIPNSNPDVVQPIDLQLNVNPFPLISDYDYVNVPNQTPLSAPIIIDKNSPQLVHEHLSHDSPLNDDLYLQGYQQTVIEGSKNPLDQDQESESRSKSQLQTIAVNDVLPGFEGSSVDNQVHVTPFTTDTNLSDDTDNKKYVTFDKWFAQQMSKIQKTGKAPNKKIDVSSLKHLIEKTLYEHGLYVTTDGVLTDSKANALNVANLKLRPFLIGDSVAYNNIFAVNGGDKFELPSNLPYLESILVTLVHPPKILGVIPLGKTFVPRISYRTGLDYGAWKARNNKGSCQSYQCVYESMKRFQNYQTIGTNHLEFQEARSHSQSSDKDWHRSPDHNDPESENVEKHNTKSKKHPKNIYKYRFNLDKVLNTFQSALFDKPDKSGNKKSLIETILPGWQKNTKDSVLTKEPSEKDKEEETLPGFRIIGGTAATYSGTPVASRGRSASYYGH